MEKTYENIPEFTRTQKTQLSFLELKFPLNRKKLRRRNIDGGHQLFFKMLQMNFFSFVVVACSQFTFVFFMLRYSTSLGECQWILQIYDIISSSHTYNLSGHSIFLFCIVILFLLLFE